jgi:hypothetical protein
MAQPADTPIRAMIRRLHIPNAVYFITGITKNRRPHFKRESRIETLRITLRNVKEYYPSQMIAYGKPIGREIGCIPAGTEAVSGAGTGALGYTTVPYIRPRTDYQLF